MRKTFREILTGNDFYRKLMVSYILLLTIILFIVWGICNKLINTISQFTNQNAYSTTVQYQTIMEGLVGSVEELPVEINHDDIVSSLVNCDGDFDDYQHYEFAKLVSKLSNYKVLNPYIISLFLYFPKQNYIISDSGVYTFDQWKSIYLNDDGFFSAIGKSNINKKWLPIKGTGNYGNKTAMITSLPLYSSTESADNLCVIIDPQEAFACTNIKNISDNSQFLTFDNENGGILFSTLPNSEMSRKYPFSLSASPYGLANHGNYITYTQESAGYPFKYIYITPSSAFLEILTFSKQIVWICIMTILIFGILLSVVFAQYNYRPIQRLANLLYKNTPAGNNSMSYIEESIVELMHMKENSETNLQKEHEFYLEGFLLKLLHNDIFNESLCKEYMEKYNITFLGEYFLVVLIKDSCGTLPARIKNQYADLLQGSLSGMAQVLTLHGHNDMKIILSFADPDSDPFRIKNTLKSVIDEFDQEITGSVNISFSNLHRRFMKLGTAYEEAKKVDEYMNFIGIQGIMSYSELAYLDTNNDNSMIFETWFEKFSNYLIDQNLEEARKIQKLLFDELKSMNYSLQFIKCKIFSFIDHTINTISELDSTYEGTLWDDLSLSDRLLSCPNIESLEREYYDIFQYLAKILLKTSKETSITENIKKIIASQYTNPGFSVTSISEVLGVSPSYISKVFKKETGRNILEYVQKLRISKAKRLMKQDQGELLSSILAQCGFYNEVSFIRVFKKYEGITPGKYKASVNHSNSIQ